MERRIRWFYPLCMLGVLCLAVACMTKNTSRLPTIPFVPLPTQTPVHLKVTSVDEFVDWISAMPSSQIDNVKQQIALVRSDPEIVDAVAGKLSFRNPGSYGRQLIYLSILGEMKNERALVPLKEYLNSRECPVFEEYTATHPVSSAPKMSIFDSCAGLKAQAINMIAYINSPATKTVVFDAIRNHASRTVRLSAINAYLYNNADTAEAHATVRRYARGEEVRFVGLPRLSPDTDPKDFASRLSRFYTEYPDEIPPLPNRDVPRNLGRGNPGTVSVTPTAGSAQGATR